MVLFNKISRDSRLSTNFDIVKRTILNKQTYLLKESRIVFTCGAAEQEDYLSTKRGILMQYSKKHLKGINFFSAEKLFKTLGEKKESDLLTIEKKLTSYSDCIIIILESPGAFTELGAFSYPDNLSKKILVVNDISFKDKESFINNGPIEKINGFSEFKDCIYTDFDNFGESISEISKRINKLTHQNRRLIDISTQEIIEKEDKYRFYLLHDLISIMYPITHKELIQLLKNIYGGLEENVNFDLALLDSLSLIERFKGFYLKKKWDQNLFLQYDNFSYDSFRSSYLIKLKKIDSRLLAVANYYSNGN